MTSRHYSEGFVHLFAKIRFFPDGLINLKGGLHIDKDGLEVLAEISHEAYVLENKEQGRESKWNMPYKDLPEEMKQYNRRMVRMVLESVNFSFDEQRLIRTYGDINEEQISYTLGMAWASWIYGAMQHKFSGKRTSERRKIWRILRERFMQGAKKALEAADGGHGTIQRREYPF